MPAPITFSLTDAEGNVHGYEVVPHPPTEGARIMWALVGLAAEPLGRLAKGMAVSGDLRRVLDAPGGVAKFVEVIDPAELAADIRRSLAAAPLDALAADLLSRCSRDGKNLANRAHFDAAFTRNYGELLHALWEVIQANRFLPLPGTR